MSHISSSAIDLSLASLLETRLLPFNFTWVSAHHACLLQVRTGANIIFRECFRNCWNACLSLAGVPTSCDFDIDIKQASVASGTEWHQDGMALLWQQEVLNHRFVVDDHLPASCS